MTLVRKETATISASSHDHIIGVVTEGGVFYSNQKVSDSIDRKNDWYTKVTGEPSAKIKVIGYCPANLCYHKPYLTTDPDHTTKNNLESLPRG